MELILPVELRNSEPRFCCVVCRRDKPLDEIGRKHKNSHHKVKTGFSYECKTCVKKGEIAKTTDKYVTGTG